MGLAIKVGQGFKDFGKGLSIIFGKPDESKGGDRRLAQVSIMVEETINSRTKHEVRRKVIKDIERTLDKEAMKGGKDAVDKKIAISLATPEYMRMLHRIGLDESHVRVMAMEALRRQNGKK